METNHKNHRNIGKDPVPASIPRLRRTPYKTTRTKRGKDPVQKWEGSRPKTGKVPVPNNPVPTPVGPHPILGRTPYQTRQHILEMVFN